MKSAIRIVALALSLMCIMAFTSPMVAYAASGGEGLDDLAGLSSDPNSGQQGSQPGNGNANPQHDDGGAISDYLQGYTPVTGDNMQQAGQIASPIVSFIGTASGFVIMIVSAAIFLVTALDLAYIGLPFTRGLLNPEYAAAGAAGGMAGGMGGMGMGGMGMGMRGGMGMGMGGGMAGGAQPMGEHGLRRKWVSDEAVYCVQTYASHGAAAAGAAGGMGMGGMGMGGMGMGGMGGMGAMGGGAQQPMPMKSIILEYLKKRSFFLIIFAVATVILMSSVFTDCGLNLAALLTKIMNGVSGKIGDVDVNF